VGGGIELARLGAAGRAAASLDRWIAQGTIPKWAPHSWFAGTLRGLPVRCCMMIGVNNR
jgi:hypothetical protein